MSNQESQRFVSFYPKIPPFIGACSLLLYLLCECFADIKREKFFSKSFLLKNASEWNSFVYFSVDEENCREPAKQQKKGKTERDVSLSSGFYRSYFVFYLLIFKSAILLKFIHFQFCIQSKQLPYPYPY